VRGRMGLVDDAVAQRQVLDDQLNVIDQATTMQFMSFLVCRLFHESILFK
jgi:hypothetical protein